MTTKTVSRRSANEGLPEQRHDVRSNIKDVLAEAKKIEGKPNINLLKTQTEPTLIHVLLSIEETIKHLTTIYASSRITNEKKKEFERIIREAETRSMAILTILRNR